MTSQRAKTTQQHEMHDGEISIASQLAEERSHLVRD